MTISVFDLISETQIELKDTSSDRWGTDQLVAYLNAGQVDITTRSASLGLRPAYVRTLPLKLTSGAVQSCNTLSYNGTVITDLIRLLNISRNLGRTWITGTKYYADEAVYDPNDNNRYIALLTHTAGATAPNADSTNWELSQMLGGPEISQIHPANLVATLGDVYSATPRDDSSITYWSPAPLDTRKFTVYPPQPRVEDSDGAFAFVEASYSAIPGDVNHAITAFATSGGGSATACTSAAHGKSTGDKVFIVGSTNYNGEHTITVTDANTYTIPVTYVAETPGRTTAWCDNIVLRDEYKNALLTYILWRAFKRDDDTIENGTSKADGLFQDYKLDPIFALV